VEDRFSAKPGYPTGVQKRTLTNLGDCLLAASEQEESIKGVLVKNRARWTRKERITKKGVEIKYFLRNKSRKRKRHGKNRGVHSKRFGKNNAPRKKKLLKNEKARGSRAVKFEKGQGLYVRHSKRITRTHDMGLNVELEEAR